MRYPEPHYNQLSADEDERLAMMGEECAETIHIICKIQRHGMNSYNPYDPDKTPNRILLRNELAQVVAQIEDLFDHGDLGDITHEDFKDMVRKRRCDQRFMHCNSPIVNSL